MNRQKLVDTLEVVGKAVERNNLIPIYEYYCFDGETIFAWNDVFGIEAPYQVPTPFAVHGPTFLGLLKASKEDTIDLKVSGSQLKIQTGKSEFVLPIKGPEDFVWTDRPTFKQGQEIDVDIIKGIEHCLSTTSDNLALENFTRVCIGTYDGHLAVYSTDGDALTRYITTIKYGTLATLARDFCEAIVKAEGGKLIIEHNWICALTGDYKIIGRNLGPSTIDYEDYISRILEGPIPDTISFPLKLNDALSRARVVADIETSPTKLLVEDNEMALMTETPFGEVYDVMPAKKHPNAEVAVNASTFQTSMAGCSSFRILDKCCILKGDQLLRLISNL